ncbi:MAG: 3-phosphoserine/phosphohydroxythreonine transaminase [Spirochaetes bacterium]|nr:3-phosphoserine/phosphohydroxythreonine transaminase [Spirochaetota bacterium]
MSRIYNFSSGPSMLPLPVLQEVAEKLVDFDQTGMSLIEMSHREKIYDGIHTETIALMRKIYEVPDDFHILFLQGGATMQFGMIPLAFLHKGSLADFIITGTWAQKAHADASVVGKTAVVWDGKSDNYARIPSQRELQFSPNATYVHLCTNETIQGIQWQYFPETNGIPIVADMSSDVLSRRIPWKKFGLIFAGTQKNLAPSGLAVVFVHRDFAARARTDLPAYLRYDLHIKENSLYNTPPTFVVWVMNVTLKWIQSIGGLDEIERLRDIKAEMIYAAIDESGGFYKTNIPKESRSKMNIVWRMGSDELEKKFVEEAKKEGFDGLKGHRSVGGLRASIYNAMPIEGVKALVDFMRHFQHRYG